MVFYTGRSPNGTKTKWKINEYKAVHGDTSASTPLSNLEVPSILCNFAWQILLRLDGTVIISNESVILFFYMGNDN